MSILISSLKMRCEVKYNNNAQVSSKLRKFEEEEEEEEHDDDDEEDNVSESEMVVSVDQICTGLDLQRRIKCYI